MFMLKNKPTNNTSIVSILYIPQKINEIEILHKNATDILIVYSFKDLLLSKSPDPWVCQFSVGSLEKNIHGHAIHNSYIFKKNLIMFLLRGVLAKYISLFQNDRIISRLNFVWQKHPSSYWNCAHLSQKLILRNSFLLCNWRHCINFKKNIQFY